MEIKYKGKKMGEVKDGNIVFYGTDLNELIDDSSGNISTETDENGNIIFVKNMPTIEQKIMIMKGLGFEFS